MTLDLRLKAYQPNGVSRGILPAPDGFTLALPLNDTPSLTLNYGVAGPRSDLLGQPVELAVEVSGDGGQTWTEPDDCRFLYLRDGRDPIKTADTWQAEAPGYLWRLQKARVLDEGQTVEGRRSFANVTPGQILATFWTEAKARGALAGVTLQGDATMDAAGVAWGATLSRDYDLGADYLQVLLDLAAGGWLDFRMTARTLKLYRPDTALATDRTVGDAQVQLTPLTVTEAPFRRTWEGLADFIQVAGDEGTSVGIVNGAALTPWGRWEDFLTQGGVSDEGTLTAMGQRYQTLTATERAEFTQAISLGGDGPRPLVDFMPGDYIWTRDMAGVRSRYRVRQVTLQKEGNAVTGNVVLNDRFLEADIRTRRTLDALTGGASGGSTGGPPALPGPDILAPGQVTGLQVLSLSYLAGGLPRATMNLNWADLTVNADGTPLTDLGHYEVWTKEPTDAEWRHVTDVAESAVNLSPYEPGWAWEFRVRAVDTAGNQGAYSDPVSQVAAGDDTPPVKPKAAETDSRMGTGQIFWDGTNGVNGGAMSPDHAYVEAHVSATSGFTVVAHDPATVVGQFSGPFVLPLPTLPYNVPHYVKLVAFDTSGNMSEESAQATLTVTPLVDTDLIGKVLDGANIQDGTIVASDAIIGKTVTGALIQGLAIDGGHIKGNAIDGKTITGAVVQTDSRERRGVKTDIAGLRAYTPTGDVFLNVDPAAGMAMVAGEVKSVTFTVSSSNPAKPAGSSLGGVTEIANGGMVRLTGGTTAPKSAPTLDSDYLTVQYANDGNWDTRYGWATADGVDFYTARLTTAGDVNVERWRSGILQATVVTYAMKDPGLTLGLTVGGGYLWLLTMPSGSLVNPRIWRSTLAGVGAGAADWTSYDSAKRTPALAWDAATSELVVAQSRADSGKVRFHRFTNIIGNSLVVGGATVNTDVDYTANLSTLLVGPADFGASRYVISNRISSTFRSFSSTGVEQVSEAWPSGMSAKAGMTYVSGTFQSIDQAGLVRIYTSNWSTNDADQIKWVTNTLAYGSSPTYQTPASPAASITLPKRSRLVVTTSAIVNDGSSSTPDRVRIFVGRGTSNPGRLGQYLASAPGAGVITQAYDALGLPSSGTVAPSGNSFPGGTGSYLAASTYGFWVDHKSDGSLGTGTLRAEVENLAASAADAIVDARVGGSRKWGMGPATTDANGQVSISHGLGTTPSGLAVSKIGSGSRTVEAQSVDSTTLLLQARDEGGTATADGTSVNFAWEVWA